LRQKPEASDLRKNGRWLINRPRFEKKIKQRIYWRTAIDKEAEALKVETVYSDVSGIPYGSGINYGPGIPYGDYSANLLGNPIIQRACSIISIQRR